MAFRCPSCDKPLYNRRRPTCGSCGATVPEYLLLNATQRQRIENLQRDETKSHREFMERDLSTGSGGVGGVDIPSF